MRRGFDLPDVTVVPPTSIASAGLESSVRAPGILAPLSLESSPAGRSRSPERVNREPGNGAEILVVEDSLIQGELLRRTLARHGYRPTVVGSGVEAMAKLRETNPALVISDVIMPGMDGYELCRRIRHDQSLEQIPVILVTLLTSPRDILQGVAVGADNFVVKPFDEGYLMSLVERLVEGQPSPHSESSVTLEITYGGERFRIPGDRQQILQLLFSTFELAVAQREELARTQTELEQANRELHTAVLRTALDGFWLFDAKGTILEVNEAYCELSGYAKAEMLEKHVGDLEASDEPNPLLERLPRISQAGSARFESHHRSKDGRVLNVEFSVTSLGGGKFSAFIRDVTEQRHLERQLRLLSFHDQLTGLYNRAYFDEELSRLEVGRDYPVTLMMLDVDGLKLVNDTWGHTRGNELLQTFSRILRGVFRKSDVIARVGGDEFAVILSRTGSEEADALLKRLRAALEDHSRSSERPYHLSVSVGLSVAAQGDSLKTVLDLADKQMYADKMRRAEEVSVSQLNFLLESLPPKDFGEGHLTRVRAWSRQLGLTLGLPEQALADLDLTARIHDLGKVGLDDALLGKFAPMTDEEKGHLALHSVIGYRIARLFPPISRVAEFILHHHECWNGTGYPGKLAGDSIPIVSRVVSLVDTYDALIHDRPYRRALGPDQAEAEIVRLSGVQFDPQVVSAFLGLLHGNGSLQAPGEGPD